MAHSNQVREFLLTDDGVELRDVYAGPSGDLITGSARDTLEAREKAQAVARAQGVAGKDRKQESPAAGPWRRRLPRCRQSSTLT